MVILRQKEFSWLNSPNDLGPDNALVVPKLIIKAFELAGMDDGIYLHHWLYDKVCTDNFKYCNNKRIPLQLSVIFATGDNFDSLPLISPLSKSTIEANKKRFKTTDEFLVYAKKEIIKDKIEGRLKYPQLTLNKMIDNNTYKLIFKTVALYLAEQIGEDVVDNLWGNLYSIDQTEVNYRKFKSPDYNRICRMFSSLLCQVLGYTNTGILDLEKVINP